MCMLSSSRTTKVCVRAHVRARTADCARIRNNCRVGNLETYDESVISAVLKSPMYPNNYCTNLDCLTLIQPAADGKQGVRACAHMRKHGDSIDNRRVPDRRHTRLSISSTVSNGR